MDLPTDIVAEIMGKTLETYRAGMLVGRDVRRVLRICVPKFEAVRRWSRVIKGACTLLPNGMMNGLEERLEKYEFHTIKSQAFYVGGEMLWINVEIYSRDTGGLIRRKRFAHGTLITWRNGHESVVVKEIEKNSELHIKVTGDQYVIFEDAVKKNIYREHWEDGVYILKYWSESIGKLYSVHQTFHTRPVIWEIAKGGALREELEKSLA